MTRSSLLETPLRPVLQGDRHHTVQQATVRRVESQIGPDVGHADSGAVGIAPRGAEGLGWYDGMTRSNVLEHTAAADGYEGLAALTEAAAEAVRADPASLLTRLQAEMPDPDLRVVADRGIRAMLLETYTEALRTSAHGWIDDALAFCSPWGFDPALVTVPVLLWHGASDNFSPVSHARWLADRIPRAAVVVQADAAHFGALDVLPDILRWLSAEQRAA